MEKTAKVFEEDLREQIAQEIETVKGTMGIATIIPDDLRDSAKQVWEAARLFYASIARGSK